MVGSCVNPACGAEFKQLSGGDLYALERRASDTEFFWLCSGCAAVFDLWRDVSGKVGLRRRGAGGRMRSPQPDGNLRLVTRGLRSLPRRDDSPASGRPMISCTGEWGGLAHRARF
jgi:hypothetical protein